MKTFVVENTWVHREIVEMGWGNGYVILPVGHKYHGVEYYDIPVYVHGGLTFSAPVDNYAFKKWGDYLSEEDLGGWIVGFDTAHLGDTLQEWTKSRVIQETQRLKKSLDNKDA